MTPTLHKILMHGSEVVENAANRSAIGGGSRSKEQTLSAISPKFCKEVQQNRLQHRFYSEVAANIRPPIFSR